MKLETADEHAKMASSPGSSNMRTDLFDIGPALRRMHGPGSGAAGSGGVLMTGDNFDPAEEHYSLLIGSDRS